MKSSCFSLHGFLVPSTQPTGLWVPPLCADSWQFSPESQPGQSQNLSRLFLFSQGSLSWAVYWYRSRTRSPIIVLLFRYFLLSIFSVLFLLVGSFTFFIDPWCLLICSLLFFYPFVLLSLVSEDLLDFQWNFYFCNCVFNFEKHFIILICLKSSTLFLFYGSTNTSNLSELGFWWPSFLFQ